MSLRAEVADYSIRSRLVKTPRGLIYLENCYQILEIVGNGYLAPHYGFCALSF